VLFDLFDYLLRKNQVRFIDFWNIVKRNLWWTSSKKGNYLGFGSIGERKMTILVALPVDDDGVVLVADTRVTHFHQGTYSDGRQKIRKIGTHCVFATTGSPEYVDASGHIVADLTEIVEDCLSNIHNTSRYPILIDPTAISQDLCDRLGKSLNGVNAAFNECSFFLVYEYTKKYGLIARSFETELIAGQPLKVWEKQILLETRPFWDRVRGQNEKALASGSGPYKSLKQNDLFNRMMAGETLSIDESFDLAYEFVRAAISIPAAQVSPTIEAILLNKDGLIVRQPLGSDVTQL
jgi:hypothetical protein